MIRGVVFDADGTLLDSMGIWDGLAKKYLLTKGKCAHPDILDDMYALSMDQVSIYLKDTYTLKETPEVIKEDILSLARDYYLNEMRLKPGARELLETLAAKNIPMSVASSNERELLVKTFENLDILKYFSKVCSCNDYNTDKSRPDVYFEASKGFGLKPNEIAVFEDALFAIKTARMAGFFVVGVEDETAAGEKEEIMNKCDIYLHDLSEFKAF